MQCVRNTWRDNVNVEKYLEHITHTVNISLYRIITRRHLSVDNTLLIISFLQNVLSQMIQKSNETYERFDSTDSKFRHTLEVVRDYRLRPIASHKSFQSHRLHARA